MSPGGNDQCRGHYDGHDAQSDEYEFRTECGLHFLGRIPGFGAIKASSRHWKRFEYGAYENRQANLKLIVSSGIGTTFLHYRINCPPEIVLLNFF